MTNHKGPNRIDPEQRIWDMTWLHPTARPRFQKLEERLLSAHSGKETRTLFLPFETYRTPHRQAFIERTNPKATAAKPFQSAHQYGLAVDFVPYEDDVWSWADHHDYGFLSAMAKECGLWVPYKWDKCHVEHPKFDWIRPEVSSM